MENSCWQVLSQSDGFLQLEDKDKETLFRLLQYEGDLKDIRLNDVFQIPDDNSTIHKRFFAIIIFQLIQTGFDKLSKGG